MSKGIKVADPAAGHSVDLQCVVNGAGTKVTITIDNLGVGDGLRLGDRLRAPVAAVVKAFYGERVKFVEEGEGPLPAPPDKAKMS